MIARDTACVIALFCDSLLPSPAARENLLASRPLRERAVRRSSRSWSCEKTAAPGEGRRASSPAGGRAPRNSRDSLPVERQSPREVFKDLTPNPFPCWEGEPER